MQAYFANTVNANFHLEKLNERNNFVSRDVDGDDTKLDIRRPGCQNVDCSD
jgi:hypothetical protein